MTHEEMSKMFSELGELVSHKITEEGQAPNRAFGVVFTYTKGEATLKVDSQRCHWAYRLF